MSVLLWVHAKLTTGLEVTELPLNDPLVHQVHHLPEEVPVLGGTGVQAQKRQKIRRVAAADLNR